ncbi:MAG: hypothetical protein KDB06_01875 [Ilumatobacter sp.]|nr:hypothetical protein [Ilumatobacter sp.]
MSRDPSPATFEGGPLDPDDTGEDLSRWGYWVPFEPSIDAALDRLRHAVFNSGQYVLPGVLGFGPNFAELDAKWREENPGEAEDEDEAGEAWDGSVPESIEALLEAAVDAGGTRTVIDMVAGVSETPEFMAVSPLTDSQLTELFGTDRPTRAEVEAQSSRILAFRDGWVGAYVIAYAAGTPAWLYFTGSSGAS